MIAVESSAWNLNFNSDNDRTIANYNFGNFLSRVKLIIEIIYFTRKNRGTLMIISLAIVAIFFSSLEY